MVSILLVLFAITRCQELKIPDIIQGVGNIVTGDGGNVIIGDNNVVHTVDVTFSDDFNKMMNGNIDIAAKAQSLIDSRIGSTSTQPNAELNNFTNSQISSTGQNNSTENTSSVKIQSITSEPIQVKGVTSNSSTTTVSPVSSLVVPLIPSSNNVTRTDNTTTKSQNRIVVASTAPDQRTSFLPQMMTLLLFNLLL